MSGLKKYQFYYSDLSKQRPISFRIATKQQEKTSNQLNSSWRTKLKLQRQAINLDVKPAKTNFFMAKSDTVPRYDSFFKGKVLDGQDDYKQYLMQSLQSKTNKKIINTCLLFAYDPFNAKANIHNYIDNQSNILLLCKTTQGYHIAAFSQSAVRNGNIADGVGLILSLTNRRCFELMADKKAVRYDKQYLIFGNSEIRVCGSDKKLFSNFGINNCHFDSKRERVGSLLGEGDSKQVILESFEVHQIVFK